MSELIVNVINGPNLGRLAGASPPSMAAPPTTSWSL